MSWADDVVQALTNLGGQASLEQIYAEIQKIRPDLKPSWRSNVRDVLHSFSSDCEAYKKTRRHQDLFRAVNKGTGLWALRDFKKPEKKKKKTVKKKSAASIPEKDNEEIKETREFVGSSVFQLKAITLRGIGPYYCGSRLEIAPITILCGQNGTGKSTWMNSIRALKHISSNNNFPFEISQNNLPRVFDCPSILNSILMTAAENNYEYEEEAREIVRLTEQASKARQDDDIYGPLGSIGLECLVLQNAYLKDNRWIRIFDDKKILSSDSDNILNMHIKAGDYLCLRVSFKSGFVVDTNYDPDTVARIDFFKNNKLIFRFMSGHIIVCKSLMSVIDSGYNIASNSGHEILSFGLNELYEYKKERNSLENTDSSCNKKYSQQHHNLLLCIDYYKAILYEVLNANFFLASTRDRLDEDNYPYLYDYSDEQAQTIVKKRHVGDSGKYALQIERAYARTFLWQRGKFTKKMGVDLVKNRIHDMLSGKLSSEKDIKQAENNILKEIFSHEEDNSRVDDEITSDRAREIAVGLLSYPLVHYTEDWMFYALPIYIHYWLHKLEITRVSTGAQFAVEPCGVWPCTGPEPINDGDSPVVGDTGLYLCDNNRWQQGALCNLSGVDALSSGFHYIYPMIVQTAVMWPGETFSIESPEAHLHPALQIKIAEYFQAHAKSGRNFIIETHSDLIIRRILRGILEEQLEQSNVRIYFTKTEHIHKILQIQKTGKTIDELTSVLEPVKINERGRISNWPKGFLDEDILESRRLIDAMYGECDSDDEEGES